jgi:hypothetical protein
MAVCRLIIWCARAARAAGLGALRAAALIPCHTRTAPHRPLRTIELIDIFSVEPVRYTQLVYKERKLSR